MRTEARAGAPMLQRADDNAKELRQRREGQHDAPEAAHGSNGP